MTDLASRLLRRAQPQPAPHPNLSLRSGPEVPTPLAFLDEPQVGDIVDPFAAAVATTATAAAPPPPATHHETLVVHHHAAAQPEPTAEPRTLPRSTPTASPTTRPPREPTPPPIVEVTRISTGATIVHDHTHHTAVTPAPREPGREAPGPVPVSSASPPVARVTPASPTAPTRDESPRPVPTATSPAPAQARPAATPATPAALPSPPRAAAPHHLDPQPRDAPAPLQSEPPAPRVVINNLHIELVREVTRTLASPAAQPPRRAPAQRQPAQAATATRVRPRLAFGMRQL